MVQIVRLGSEDATGYETNIIQKQPSSKRFIYGDEIRFGNDERGYCGSIFGAIGSVFSSIWGTIKSIFKTIFFCCDCSSGVKAKMNIQEKTELRDKFQSLQKELVSKRNDSSPREETVSWWQKEFDALSEEAQNLLLMQDARAKAKNKLKNENPPATEDHINQYALSRLKDQSSRENSVQYVRDLVIFEVNGTFKNTIWDPLDNSEVPFYLNEVANNLTQEIESQKS